MTLERSRQQQEREEVSMARTGRERSGRHLARFARKHPYAAAIGTAAAAGIGAFLWSRRSQRPSDEERARRDQLGMVVAAI